VEFHFSARALQAGKNGGAAAVSAYIAGKRSYLGQRLNSPHGPGEVAFGGLELPSGACFNYAEDLWIAADLAERKKDGSYQARGGNRRPAGDGKAQKAGVARIAVHADMALPWGTDAGKARAIAYRICRYLIETHRVGVQWACHTKNGIIDHLHFLWTTRTLSDAGFGKKARSLNAIAQRSRSGATARSEEGLYPPEDAKSRNPMTQLRHFAADTIRMFTGVYWDPRSFADRGIDLVPEPKLDRRRLREEQRRAQKEAKRGGERVIDPTPIEVLLGEFRRAQARVKEEQAAERRADQEEKRRLAEPSLWSEFGSVGDVLTERTEWKHLRENRPAAQGTTDRKDLGRGEEASAWRITPDVMVARAKEEARKAEAERAKHKDLQPEVKQQQVPVSSTREDAKAQDGKAERQHSSMEPPPKRTQPPAPPPPSAAQVPQGQSDRLSGTIATAPPERGSSTLGHRAPRPGVPPQATAPRVPQDPPAKDIRIPAESVDTSVKEPLPISASSQIPIPRSIFPWSYGLAATLLLANHQKNPSLGIRVQNLVGLLGLKPRWRNELLAWSEAVGENACLAWVEKQPVLSPEEVNAKIQQISQRGSPGQGMR
jgi:hypothetical protein